MKTPPRVLVIVPAFNEQETIGDVVGSVAAELPEADLVVINDGSRDKTAEVAEALGARVISHPYNLGIGASMQTGFKYALRYGYDVAVQVDADGQHPPSEIKNLVGPLERGEAKVVIGSRFLSDGRAELGAYRPSLARGAGIALFSRLVSFILGEKITDTTSGFRASSVEVIRFLSTNYPEDYPEVEALVLLHKKGFAIMEVPVKMEKRKGGRSSITPTRSVYYMVKVLLAIFVDLIKRVD